MQDAVMLMFYRRRFLFYGADELVIVTPSGMYEWYVVLPEMSG